LIAAIQKEICELTNDLLAGLWTQWMIKKLMQCHQTYPGAAAVRTNFVSQSHKRSWVARSSIQRLGYGLDMRGFNFRKVMEFFSSPPPDRLWCPPSLLSNGYQGLLPRRG
jgi:hypothetical protein